MNELEKIVIDESRSLADRWDALMRLECDSAIDADETCEIHRRKEIEEAAAMIRWENS